MTRSQERTLAPFLAVIRECIKRDYDNGPSGRTLDAVLAERFPVGPGGVGHANRRAQAEIRQQIADYYAPRDWSPEPTYGREFA